MCCVVISCPFTFGVTLCASHPSLESGPCDTYLVMVAPVHSNSFSLVSFGRTLLYAPQPLECVHLENRKIHYSEQSAEARI
ncbi:hypothetical protein M3J09_007202 [Ascochyta lentis]